ncbi:hypothetical protein CDD83_4365 [Cordyceps sp. RAO-2017]|nr:hypothetical protein CDD83_4365 [Cordyceps sp. RAO-2017]
MLLHPLAFPVLTDQSEPGCTCHQPTDIAATGSLSPAPKPASSKAVFGPGWPFVSVGVGEISVAWVPKLPLPLCRLSLPPSPHPSFLSLSSVSAALPTDRPRPRVDRSMYRPGRAPIVILGPLPPPRSPLPLPLR